MYLPSKPAVSTWQQVQLFMVTKWHMGCVHTQGLSMLALHSVGLAIFHGPGCTEQDCGHAAAVTAASSPAVAGQPGDVQVRPASHSELTSSEAGRVRQALHEQTWAQACRSRPCKLEQYETGRTWCAGCEGCG